MSDVWLCALCGSGLKMSQGVHEDGVQWTLQRCECGRTEFLHIDMGELDLSTLPPIEDNDFEFLVD